MLPRLLTLRYIDRIEGFSEEPIAKACYGREVLDASCELFMHGNEPRALVFLKLSNYVGPMATGKAGKKGTKSDATELKLLEEKIRPDDRAVYQKLKDWRNGKIAGDKTRMQTDFLPHNLELVQLVLAAPLTPEDMKKVKDVRPEVADRHAGEILNILFEIKRPEEGFAPDSKPGEQGATATTPTASEQRK